VGGSLDEAASELEKLAELLRDLQKRKSFYLNPEAMMEAEGVDADAIPPRFLDTLKELSHAELGVVSRVESLLRDRLSDDELQLIVMFPV